jgi:hypothetical protein
MRDADQVVEEIIGVLREKGLAQVPGYAPFRYLRRNGAAVFVERRNGNEAKILASVLRRAVEAVREDETIYVGGPSRLREYGITHVTSPTWALLRLLPLNAIIQ